MRLTARDMCADVLLSHITITEQTALILSLTFVYAHVNSLIVLKDDHDEPILYGFIVSKSIKSPEPKVSGIQGMKSLGG